MQILYSHFQLVISNTLLGSFLDELFLLLAVILSEFQEKPIWNKDEVQKKAHRIIFVRNLNFLIARSPFYYNICYFLCVLPPFSQVTNLLNDPYKDA